MRAIGIERFKEERAPAGTSYLLPVARLITATSFDTYASDPIGVYGIARDRD